MFTLITIQLSPQIWKHIHHPDPHSPWSCLPQWKLEDGPIHVIGRQGESMLLPQGWGWAQKKGRCWVLGCILRQQQKPAEFTGSKCGLGWSHPIKSSTCMTVSIYDGNCRQLRELLDKASGVVPANLCCKGGCQKTFVQNPSVKGRVPPLMRKLCSPKVVGGTQLFWKPKVC